MIRAILCVALVLIGSASAHFTRCQQEVYCSGSGFEYEAAGSNDATRYDRASCTALSTGFYYCRLDMYVDQTSGSTGDALSLKLSNSGTIMNLNMMGGNPNTCGFHEFQNDGTPVVGETYTLFAAFSCTVLSQKETYVQLR